MNLQLQQQLTSELLILRESTSSYNYYPEGDRVDNTDTFGQKENVYADEAVHKIDTHSLNTVSLSGAQHLLSLDDFFKRPVGILNLEIDLTDSLQTVRSSLLARIEPYALWSRDPSVRAKLSNYAYFRGDLKIVATLTSSPFNVGSILISNQPFFDDNATFGRYLIDGNGDQILSYMYNSPEKVLMMTGSDTSYELAIPFVSPKSAVRLYNITPGVLPNTTDFTEMKSLSTLEIRTFNTLDSLSQDYSTNISLQIYAYCDNISLGPATGSNLQIVPESDDVDNGYNKEEASDFKNKVVAKVNSNKTLNSIANFAKKVVPDEYSTPGPLSTIASAVSKFSTKFTSVPYIAPFATATSIFSGKVSDGLKFFGFSKPSLIESPCYNKIVTFNQSLGISDDTSFKMTTDPKQEISIFPMGGENPVDPMAVTYLSSREGYLNTFTWNVADETRTTVLYTEAIDPMVHINFDNNQQCMLPMGFAALPFRYWRGSICFRFEVMCSTRTRGNLMIIYEPNNNDAAGINAGTTTLNQQMITYMDISKETTKTIRVGYVNDRSFLKIRDLNTDVSLAIGNGTDETSLGTITVKPYTKLVGTPTSGPLLDQVEINVYAYSDDLELAFPKALGQSFYSFNSSPSPLLGQDIVQESDSQPTFYESRVGTNIYKGTEHNINLVKNLDEKAFLYNFGERIPSFRTLLKKDFSNSRYALTNTDQFGVYLYPITSRVFRPGGGGAGIGFAGAQAKNLFNYLRYGYLGMKGGFRHRLLQSVNADDERGQVIVCLTDSKETQGSMNDTGSINLNLEAVGLASVSGSALFHRKTSEGVEFEIPYFSRNFFELGFRASDSTVRGSSYWSTAGILHFDEEYPVALMRSEGTLNSSLDIISSAAEDFTFFRFQGVPLLGRNERTDLGTEPITF